jgi:hypothetical protein
MLDRPEVAVVRSTDFKRILSVKKKIKNLMLFTLTLNIISAVMTERGPHALELNCRMGCGGVALYFFQSGIKYKSPDIT